MMRRGRKQFPVKQFYLDPQKKDLTTMLKDVQERFDVFDAFSKKLIALEKQYGPYYTPEALEIMEKYVREFHWKYCSWENGIQYDLSNKDSQK